MATKSTVKAKKKQRQPSDSTANINQPSIYPPPPPFIDSVSSLRSLSTSLSAFIHTYDDLESHLRYIHTNLLSNSSVDPLSEETPLPSPNNAITPKPTTPAESELEIICQSNYCRDLRLYFMSHLNEIEKLRIEAPKALNRCRDPAKFIFDCLGRFYLQGIKAYVKDSPMINSREASIFGLECFLLMESDGVVIDPKVKEDASLASFAWRNRLITEGGVDKACEADARGLLLFISCFGIPNCFTNLDLRSLIRMCNLNDIAPALRRSTFLRLKIEEILEEMMKSNLEFDAVEIAYVLQLGDLAGKFLTEVLNKLENAWKDRVKQAKSSPIAVNDANRKQLINLKSVINWFEKHKLNPKHIIPEYKIIDKITSLEKEILRLDKEKQGKTLLKRSTGQRNFSKKDTKRQRVSDPVLQHTQPNKVNGYTTAPKVTYMPSAVPAANNVHGLLAAYAGTNLSTAQIDVHPKVDTALQTGSNYIQFNGQHDDTTTLYDKYVPHNSIYGLSTLVDHTFTRMPSPPIGTSYGLPGRLPLSGLPTQQHQMSGFLGLPSQQGDGNLYHFADILDSQLKMELRR